MDAHHFPTARILNHSNGMGVPSAETVRERALELANIDGRTKTDERDWDRAKNELRGGHADHNGSGQEMAGSVSEHDMVSPGLGHQTPRYSTDDDDSVLEELVAEGLDEAAHEQMLEARRAMPDEE